MARRPNKRVKPSTAKSGRITREELEQKGGTLPIGNSHWVRKELKSMNVGELLFVHQDDWNWHGYGNTPSRIANGLNKRTNRKYVTMLAKDNSGWVIERMA